MLTEMIKLAALLIFHITEGCVRFLRKQETRTDFCTRGLTCTSLCRSPCTVLQIWLYTRMPAWAVTTLHQQELDEAYGRELVCASIAPEW